MNITLRRRQIILELLSTKKNLTIDCLAGLCQVSKRSIHYDLDEIEAWAKTKGLILERKAGVGVRLLHNGQMPSALFDDDYSVVPTSEEISKRILRYLLEHQRFVSIQELSNAICTGKNTITRGIDQLSGVIAEFDAKLERKPGFGIRLVGNEYKLRQCIYITFLPDATHLEHETSNKTNWFDEQLQTSANNIEILPRSLLVQVREELHRTESKHRVSLVDHSFHYLSKVIAIALYRMERHCYIEKMEWPAEIQLNNKLNQVISEATESLERRLHIVIPESERIYFRILSSGMHLLDSVASESDALHISDEDLATCRDFIMRIEALLRLRIWDDLQFRNTLLRHLQPMLNRLKLEVSVKNPLISEILERYGEVFSITKTAAVALEKRMGKKLNDDEIGFLALYVCAAIEQYDVENRRSKVLVVCNSGLGTAHLLTSILQRKLPEIEIIKTTSQYEWEEFEASADLIISTIKLSKAHKPVILVPPLPSDADIQKIRSFLDVEPLPAVIYNEIETMKSLIDWEAGSIGLDRALTKEMVALGITAANWEDAIERVGTLLLDAGFVSDTYIQKMIDAVKEYGPFIVVVPGVALAHAKPEAGEVNRVCLSMVTLDEPVDFGTDQACPVKLLFAFGTPDDKSHKTMLSQLTSLILPEQDRMALMQATTYEEVSRTIQRHTS